LSALRGCREEIGSISLSGERVEDLSRKAKKKELLKTNLWGRPMIPKKVIELRNEFT